MGETVYADYVPMLKVGRGYVYIVEVGEVIPMLVNGCYHYASATQKGAKYLRKFLSEQNIDGEIRELVMNPDEFNVLQCPFRFHV